MVDHTTIDFSNVSGQEHTSIMTVGMDLTHNHSAQVSTTAEPLHPTRNVSSFWSDPMVHSFGIVLILFVVTLIVALINVYIWLIERRKGHNHLLNSVDHGGSKSTSLTFAFGKLRSSTVGVVA